jgi:hypothetical protein
MNDLFIVLKSFLHLAPKWRKVENDNPEENSSINDEDDDYDELLERHHRHMLEEQKDRKYDKIKLISNKFLVIY